MSRCHTVFTVSEQKMHGKRGLSGKPLLTFSDSLPPEVSTAKGFLTFPGDAISWRPDTLCVQPVYVRARVWRFHIHSDMELEGWLRNKQKCGM